MAQRVILGAIKIHEGRKSTNYLSALFATLGAAMLSDELFASKTHTNVCANMDGLVYSTIEPTCRLQSEFP